MADLFLDTFTGTGTLATHVPDLGGAWVDSTRPFSQFVLNGDGTMQRTNAAGDNGQIAIPVADPGGAVGWEVHTVIKRAADGESSTYVELESFDNGLYATIYALNGLDMIVELDAPSGEFVEYEIPEQAVVGAEYVLRVEISADRLTLTAYLNDALILTIVETEPMPLAGNVWTQLDCRGASLPVQALSSVRMYEAVPPEPEVIGCCPPLPLRLDLGCGTESCGRAFSDKTIGWSDTVKEDGEYTFPESRLAPVETVYATLPIGRETQEYRLTLGSVLWAPLTIAALEWTGQYFNNTGRKS